MQWLNFLVLHLGLLGLGLESGLVVMLRLHYCSGKHVPKKTCATGTSTRAVYNPIQLVLKLYKIYKIIITCFTKDDY